MSTDSHPTGMYPAPFNLLTCVAADPEMSRIFSERETVDAWLRVEVALASAQAELGIVPASAAEALRDVAHVDRLDLAALWRETRTVGYPILPLVRQLDALLPESERGHVHMGATTQDIMDTGLVLQLLAASDRLTAILDRIGDGLAARVREHAGTVMAARTHAMHAVPTSLGAKLAVYLASMTRHRERAMQARSRLAVLSMHGAGGTSAAYGPNASGIRELVAAKLGLRAEEVPWHVGRDRIAEWAQTWTLTLGTAARFAREVIDLSRNEIAEVSEPVGHHRGASSTMPQKRNPITSEAIVGCAIVAGSLGAAVARIMEPGHERAAGEWQAEWYVIPAIASLGAAGLVAMADLVEGLRVDPEQMRRNLTIDHGLIMAEAYMIALAPKLGRERAHELVYAAAAASRADGIPLHAALTRALDAEQLGAIDTIDFTDYIGDARRIADAAIEGWMAGKAAP